MRYIVELKSEAEKDLKAMPKDEARVIYDALLALESGLKGDIKKLTDHWPEYRLRVVKMAGSLRNRRSENRRVSYSPS